MNSRELILVCLLGAVVVVGCGGSRGITIEGYDQRALDGKRIALLYPAPSDCVIERPELFAAARGVAVVSASDMLDNELRMMLSSALDAQLDSNEVTPYDAQPAGQVVPISLVADFSEGRPVSWEKLARGAREGNIDFMIAVTSFTVHSQENEHRGREGATIAYVLVDPIKAVVMTRGELILPLVDMITPHETYHRIATELARVLPFRIADRSH